MKLFHRQGENENDSQIYDPIVFFSSELLVGDFYAEIALRCAIDKNVDLENKKKLRQLFGCLSLTMGGGTTPWKTTKYCGNFWY